MGCHASSPNSSMSSYAVPLVFQTRLAVVESDAGDSVQRPRECPSWSRFEGHRATSVGSGVAESVRLPGPVVTRQEGGWALPDTHIDISSGEEPLVRPNMGRHVIARIEARSARVAETHLPSTVPATSQELREFAVGRTPLWTILNGNMRCTVF